MRKKSFWVFIGMMFLVSFSFGCRSVKIAFIVKDLNESWFQEEILHAQRAAERYGFDLFVYPTVDGTRDSSESYTIEQVMDDLQDAVDRGVQGVIICSPDISGSKRGENGAIADGGATQIINFCAKNNLKLMTVDDRFKDEYTPSKFNEDVPHLGVDGYQIGRLVGISLAQSLLDAGKDSQKVGILEIRNDNYPDIMVRVDGANLLLQEVLEFKEDQFIRLHMDPLSRLGAYNTVMEFFPEYQDSYSDWILISSNDDSVIGGVQALNDLGVDPERIFAYGINGSTAAIAQLQLPYSTGFLGSIKLAADFHGYDSCKYMYEWITSDIEPEKVIFSNGTLLVASNVLDKVSVVNDVLDKVSPVNDVPDKISPVNDIPDKISPVNDVPDKISPINDSPDKIYEMNLYDLSLAPPQVSRKYNYLFEQTIVDYPTDKVSIRGIESLYLGHPDSVQLNNGNLLIAYPLGHGKGETILKESSDLGKSWSTRKKGLPSTFKNTQETPTLYKLNFKNGDQKLVLISSRPGWGISKDANGFDVSLSLSKDKNAHCDGKVWEPHENFFGALAKREEYYAESGTFWAIVAMASLTHLKDAEGNWQDKWMGIFHDTRFNVYKTYLTFDETGTMHWSYPVRVFADQYRDMEKTLQFCEPEVIRSPCGKELAMLFRTNAKRSFSQIIFSTDEGMTWSAPQELSRELTGERHKAEYDPVSKKLIIAFRSIHWPLDQTQSIENFFSLGWLAWVGDYEDLKKGEEGKGDFVVKLAHTYLPNQENPQIFAHADTGYTGLVVDPSGMFIASSYGKFSPDSSDTYVISKRFTIADLIQHFNPSAEK